MTRIVGETKDLVRIRDAPRRVWQTDPELPKLIEFLTKRLKHNEDVCNPPCEGCRAKSLLPAQAVALGELALGHAGAFGPLRPGAGKTLVSFLIPTIIQATNPLLIVPSHMEKGATRKMFRQYAKHWRLKDLTIVSYEYLSHPKHVGYLDKLKPDLIICDEAHKLKGTSSKCTKRISRYLRANETVRFVALSGSVASRSIREYAHYLRWSLKSQSPVPRDPMEVQAWSYAMDEKVPPEARFEPGALLSLSKGHEAEQDLVKQARLAYRDRLTSTKGVISTLEDVPSVNLRLFTTKVQLGVKTMDAIEDLRAKWQTPDGHDFMLAVDLWRHARTLGCGLFYKWEPYAPETWMQARRAWHKFVGERLARSRTMDSVVHLIEAIKEGRLDDQGLYFAWKKQEPLFKPNPVPVWIGTEVLDYCADWLGKNQGLVWTEHRSFGNKLAEITGLPFFASGGLDAQGRLADDYRDGPAIASIKGCGEGHNLQYGWSKNLVPSFPSKGSIAEQFMARTHRDGQPADEVSFEVLLTCRESYTSLLQAIRDAECTEQREGQPQKLVYAEKDLDGLEEYVRDRETWNQLGV